MSSIKRPSWREGSAWHQRVKCLLLLPTMVKLYFVEHLSNCVVEDKTRWHQTMVAQLAWDLVILGRQGRCKIHESESEGKGSRHLAR